MSNGEGLQFFSKKITLLDFLSFYKRHGTKIFLISIICGFVGLLEGRKNVSFSTNIRIPIGEEDALVEPNNIEVAFEDLFKNEKWSSNFVESFSSKLRKNSTSNDNIELIDFFSSDDFVAKKPVPYWINIDQQEISLHFVGVYRNFYNFVLFVKEPGSDFYIMKNISDSMNDVIKKYNEVQIDALKKNRKKKYDQFTAELEELLAQYKVYQKEDQKNIVDPLLFEQVKRKVFSFEENKKLISKQDSIVDRKRGLVNFIVPEKNAFQLSGLQQDIFLQEESRELQTKISGLYNNQLISKKLFDDFSLAIRSIEDKHELLYLGKMRKYSLLEAIQAVLNKRDSQFFSLIEREKIFIPRLDFSDESFVKFNRKNQINIKNSKTHLYTVSCFFMGLLSASLLFALIEFLFKLKKALC